MGIIIPDSALAGGPYKIEPGEKLLLKKFKESLPENCLVWHNVDLPRHYQPDIIAYIPRLGIIIIEVKDWLPSTVTKIGKNKWELSIDGRRKEVTSPLEQVRGYFVQLKNLLETHTTLLSQSGARKGSFKLPISYFVAFSKISRADLPAEASAFLSEDKFLFKEDITAIGNSLKGADLAKYFMRIFAQSFWKTEPLSPKELETLRGALYPEITLTRKSKTGDKQIVLDITQEQLAKKLDSGHHVVRGIAGSGKSLVLCAKAKLLAETKPEWKTLLTCFNTSLKAQLVFYIKNMNDMFITEPARPNWEIASFYNLLFRLARETGYNGIPDDFFSHGADTQSDEEQSLKAGEHLQQIAKLPGAPKFDAILIDESQDFHHSWLKGLMSLLNPETNFIILAEDPNQKIYKRSFTYKDAGLNIAGHVRKLPVTYRSTREIVLPASLFVQQSNCDEFFKQYVGEDNFATLFSEPAGTPPRLAIVKDDRILSHLLESIYRDTKNGMAYSDIAVICPYNEQTRKVSDFLRRAKIPAYWLVKDAKAKKEYDLTQDKVVITTIHSAKGLEFEKVYFLGFEAFPLDSLELNDRENASMIYVAMTRAKKQLEIVSTQRTKTFSKLSDVIAKYTTAENKA
ncbi:MAG: NERD domain-containing protein [Elusimicrobia bacterium]|nr:NERD domain-containing protein [Elusimicrobiota bacterium]